MRTSRRAAVALLAALLAGSSAVPLASAWTPEAAEPPRPVPPPTGLHHAPSLPLELQVSVEAREPLAGVLSEAVLRVEMKAIRPVRDASVAFELPQGVLALRGEPRSAAGDMRPGMRHAHALVVGFVADGVYMVPVHGTGIEHGQPTAQRTDLWVLVQHEALTWSTTPINDPVDAGPSGPSPPPLRGIASPSPSLVPSEGVAPPPAPPRPEKPLPWNPPAPAVENHGFSTITATLQYIDGTGVARPAERSLMIVWDWNPATQQHLFVAEVPLDAQGRGSLTVSNRDPNGDGTCFDPVVAFQTNSPEAFVMDEAGTVYIRTLWFLDNFCGDAYDYGTQNPENAQQPGWRVFQYLVDGWTYMRHHSGMNFDMGQTRARLVQEWSHYHPFRFGDQGGHPWDERREVHININDNSHRSPDVVLHEQGHHLQFRWAWDDNFFPRNPSGPHDLCEEGLSRGLTFSEGFANYWAVLVWNRLRDANDVSWNWPGTAGINLETGGSCQPTPPTGDDSEYRVAAHMWDITDAPNGDDDGLGFGFNVLWNAMDGCEQHTYFNYYDHVQAGEGTCSWAGNGNSRNGFLTLAQRNDNQIFQVNPGDYNRPPTAGVNQPVDGTWTSNPTVTIGAAVQEHDCPDACPHYTEFRVSTNSGASWTSLGSDTDGAPWTRTWNSGLTSATGVWAQARAHDGLVLGPWGALSVFNIDAIPPVPEARSTCDNWGNNGWCRGTVTATLAATDAPSGLASTACSVENVPRACGTFPITGTGYRWIRITATDLAGNSASDEHLTAIDIDPPVMSPGYSCSLPGNAGWCRGTVTLNPTASDTPATLASHQCTLDGTVVGCATVTVTAQGPHTLVQVATDHAGNTDTLTTNFQIDSIGPAITFDTDCSGSVGSGWCRGSWTITPQFSDASGIASATCTLDGAGVACTTRVVSGDGTHTYVATATDIAGNSATGTRGLPIDTTPPSLDPRIACSLQGNLGWCRGSVSLDPLAIDAHSGIASTTCTLDGVAVSCGPRTVTGEGSHTFAMQATDAAGNSASRPDTFMIDTIAPTITLTTSCTVPGNLGWCRGSVTLSAVATDAASGVASVVCRANGAVVPCSGHTFSADGVHAYAVEALDVAGNAAADSATVRIDATPPVADAASSCSLAGNAGWCRGTVTTSVTHDDATSGVASATCTLDGAAVACAMTTGAQGLHTFVLTVLDVAGNSASDTEPFKIDSVPPVPVASPACSAPGSAGWCKGTVTLALTATDATSGVATTDCGAIACGTTTLTSSGQYAVSISATDVAGNAASASGSFKIDADAPVVSLTPSCPSQGANGWCWVDVSVSSLSLDDTSGVVAESCLVDGAAVACGTITVTEGTHTVELTATDEAGWSSTATLAVNVDRVAPGGSVAVPEASLGAFNIQWEASDANSGLASLVVEEKLTGGAGWSAVCSPAVSGASAQGTCTRDPPAGHYCYRAIVTDVAGHTSTTREDCITAT